MYTIEWEFLPAPNRLAEFVEMYGPTGAWVKLFQRAEGYLNTELLPISEKPGWFRTFDRWESEEAYRAFRQAFAAEYKSLDIACEKLTAQERSAHDAQTT